METSPIEVQKALKDIDYPAQKKDMINHAKKHKASSEVMDELEKIADKEYNDAADLSKEFSGETGNIEEREGRGGQEKGGR